MVAMQRARDRAFAEQPHSSTAVALPLGSRFRFKITRFSILPEQATNFDKKKGSREGALFPTSLIVVVMDYRLASVTHVIFLLDYRGAIGWLALLDNGAIAITIMALANRRASANRSNANPDIIGKGRRGNRGDHGGSK
jgi:hypothetical protein